MRISDWSSDVCSSDLDVLALAAHLGEVLLALLQQPTSGAQLVGQALDDLVERVEHLVAVDHHGRRQRHRPGGPDDVVQASQHHLDVGARLPRALELCGVVDALFVVVHVAHRGYFSLSRLATAVGTIDDTSPHQRAMSRMYFAAMAELADADGRNSVWTPDTLRLICAWEISLSKDRKSTRLNSSH